LPRIGKKYGKLIPHIRKALECADGAAIAVSAARNESFSVELPDQTITLEGDDVLIETTSAQGFACGEDGGYLTALDTTLTDDLVLEGVARELVRTVQEARKQAGLEVSDRIILGVTGSEGVEASLLAYREFLMSETLAEEWQIGQTDPLFREKRSLDAENWSIEISLLR
jgi:isoleucyl-tRNA synthetase